MHTTYATFKVLTAVLIKIQVFWNVTPRLLVVTDVSKRSYCLAFSQYSKSLCWYVGPADGGTKLLQFVRGYWLIAMTSYPIRLQSTHACLLYINELYYHKTADDLEVLSPTRSTHYVIHLHYSTDIIPRKLVPLTPPSLQDWVFQQSLGNYEI
jgi:hypothetical protein